MKKPKIPCPEALTALSPTACWSIAFVTTVSTVAGVTGATFSGAGMTQRSGNTRSSGRYHAYVVASLLVVAVGVMSFDLQIQSAATAQRPPGVVRDYFNASEAFGNGFGVVMILGAVLVLDQTKRIHAGRLFAASLGAGLAADVVKLLIARSRPKATDVESLLASGASAWETFQGFAPFGMLGNGVQSFPSAHTATAVGLAVALATAYPLGQRLFYCFAAGVALQRVCVGAHFPSDVFAGAALGATWGHACCVAGPIANWFDRFEVWWAERFGWDPPMHLQADTEIEEEPVLLSVPTRKPIAVSTRRAA